MIRIVLPAPSPSLNTFIRAHWATRKRIGKTWAKMVRVCIPLGLPEATRPRRLTIERHGKRPIDLDNLAGGAKPIIDALRAFGLLVDDAPKWMDLVVRNVKLERGQEPHTVLLLEDLPTVAAP